MFQFFSKTLHGTEITGCLKALVVVDVLGAVWQGPNLFCELVFEAVDVDGGFLLEDGATERRREGQDHAAQADLKWRADARISESERKRYRMQGRILF